MEKNNLTEKWERLMAKEKQAKQLLQELNESNEVEQKEQISTDTDNKLPKDNFDNLLGCGG